MKMTDEVMNDLLTVYLAGEASADTRVLIENHARQSPAFASKLDAAAALSLVDVPQSGPSNDLELRALAQTRQFIFLRTLFWASGLLFTLLPLVFTFDERGVQFLVLGRHPGLVWSFWSIAAASWVACYVMHRQVRQAGL
jgi:hypothetical protein